jgi:hypothetical protein
VTFDAGSIDARLTLDRSAFSRELQEARLQAQRFEQNEITIRASLTDLSDEFLRMQEDVNNIDGRDIDLNVNVQNTEALDRLKAQIDSLTGKTVEVDVNTDLTELTLFEERIDGLRDRTIRLSVEVFSQSIQSLQARIASIEGRSVTVSVDTDTLALDALESRLASLSGGVVNVDANTTLAMEDIAQLRAELEALTPFTIQVEADTSGAFAEIAALDALLRDQGLTVHVDVNAGAAIAELAALESVIQTIDANDINVNVHMEDRGNSIGRTAGTVTRMEAIIAGILLLAPLIPAVIAPAAAAVGGLAAGLTAAAGGVGVLTLGVAPAAIEFGKMQKAITDAEDALAAAKPGTKEYREAAENLAAAQGELNDKFGGAVPAFEGMAAAWGEFQDATRPAAVGLMTQFFGIVEDILPRLTPIFNAFGVVAAGALQSIGEFINGPEGERMFTFFEEIGAQSFDEILQSLGNLTLFFGRLFEAFGPFAVDMLDGLSEITAGWAEWADGLGESNGFQEFIDYAREVGPQVLDMLGSLFDAFIAIGEALAPLAGPALTAFTALFDAIAGAPTELLTTLIVLFGGLFLAVQGFTAIGQAYRATVAAMGVATSIFGGIMTVVQGIMAVFRTAWMLLNLAFTASPIGVIIVALIALVAVFVLLYKKVDWFRNAVDAVVQAIVGAFQWLYDQLWGHSILKDLIKAFETAFEFIKKAVMVPVRLIVKGVKLVFDAILAYFKFVFGVYKTIFTTGWSVLKTIWRTAVGAVKDALKLVFDTIPQYIRDKFDRVMEIIRGLKDRITGFFGGAVNWLKDAGWNIIKGLVDGIKDAAGKILQGTLDWVTDKIPDWKGPPARDEKILRPAGGSIIGGLVAGLIDQVPSLESTLGSITNKIAATSAGISATLDARGTLPAGAATAGSGMTVNVISPSRLRVDEGLATGLKRVAAVAGYST